MNPPIFISYSSKDQNIAATICEALENRGFSCWISCRDIGPGENFQVSIVRAIRSAKVMVLVFSANSNNSEEIKKELVLAGRSGLTVIPVRVEDVTPDEAFAYELATRQWIDLFADWESAVQRLVRQLTAVADIAIGAGAKLSGDARGGPDRTTRPESESDTASIQPARRRTAPKRYIVAAAVILFLAAVGAAAWYWLWRAEDWVSFAADQAGHWAWQFDPRPEIARRVALERCGPGCGTTFTVRARCIAYAESKANGYAYGTAHGSSHDEVKSIAIGRCSAGAPAGTCYIVKDHCEGEPMGKTASPTIASVSPIVSQPAQTIVITGSGFGELSAYVGNSRFIRISDDNGWNAGSARDPGADLVTLAIVSWTDTRIVIGGFRGSYRQNNWKLNPGDNVLVEVWNPQTGAGPAVSTVKVMQATTAPLGSK